MSRLSNENYATSSFRERFPSFNSFISEVLALLQFQEGWSPRHYQKREKLRKKEICD
jgi:hypothetical protein